VSYAIDSAPLANRRGPTNGSQLTAARTINEAAAAETEALASAATAASF
jgi:hypothetical protein